MMFQGGGQGRIECFSCVDRTERNIKKNLNNYIKEPQPFVIN